jgi:hypothetical protein
VNDNFRSRVKRIDCAVSFTNKINSTVRHLSLHEEVYNIKRARTNCWEGNRAREKNKRNIFWPNRKDTNHLMQNENRGGRGLINFSRSVTLNTHAPIAIKSTGKKELQEPKRKLSRNSQK